MKDILQRLRDKAKKAFDKIHNEKLKINLLQAIPFWIASLISGLVAVLYTKLFTLLEALRTRLFQHTAWLFFIITPVCFIIAWRLVKVISPYSKGSGIPQVMA